MNLSMNNNMNIPTGVRRVTVSLPNYIYQRLVKTVPERKVSSFVARVLEEELLVSIEKPIDPIDDFLEMRKKVPKLSYKKIREAINKGRE